MRISLALLCTLLSVFSLSAQVGDSIAVTYYGLQSNASAADRIVSLGGGDFLFSWTQTEDLAGAPTRGSGYAEYINGTWNILENNGQAGAIEQNFEGGQRCGWPSIGRTSAGRTVVISHHFPLSDGPEKNGLVYNFKDEGDTDWTSMWFHDFEGVEYNPDAIWTRMGIHDLDIHLINGQWETSWNGVLQGLQYHRSRDGGDSFETIPLPGMDASEHGYIPGDRYSIDVMGEVVVIVAHSLNPTLWRSDDAGENWTMTRISSTENPTYSPDENDTFDPNYGSDGSMEVLLSQEGVAHVFMSRSLNVDVQPGDGVANFYQVTRVGINYWNDKDRGPVRCIGETVIHDSDGDLLPPYAHDRQYLIGVSSMPSAGIDTAGNIYLLFAQIVDDTYDEEGIPFRDLFLIKSLDAGNSWIGPVNITNSPSQECFYGFMAKEVDENVHLIYQHDDFTGSTSFSSQENTSANTLRYLQFPVDEIVTPENTNTVPLIFTPFAFDDVNAIWAECPVADQLVEGWGLNVVDYPEGDLTHELYTAPAIYSTANTFDVTLEMQDADGNNAYRINVIDDEPFYELNQITPWSVTIETFLDEEDPVITILGENSYFSCLNEPFFLPEILVEDNSDGFNCPEIELDFLGYPFDTGMSGEYEVTIIARDFSNNTAVETITIMVESCADPGPVITILDPETFEELEGEYTVEANPNFDFFEDVPPKVVVGEQITGEPYEYVIEGSVDMSVPGDYVLIYTVQDEVGETTEYELIVHVIDSMPPTIDSPFDNDTILVECGNVGFQALAQLTASDAFPINILIGGDPVNVDFGCYYNVTYSAQDINGLLSEDTLNIVYIVDGCSNSCFTNVESLEESLFSIQATDSPYQFFVENEALVDEELSWSLLSLNGQTLETGNWTDFDGRAELKIHVQASGMYVLLINAGASSYQQKIFLP